ncbi:unnamed protein product [Rhizophagus irregularis]|nr:unnamed protein product [Rhizophagus irregularis]
MQIWTSQAIAAGLPLSDMILQQKGLEFAKMFNMDDKLKCANGWMYSLPEEHARLRALLVKYDKEDIYNADETGLFFRMEPNQTLGTRLPVQHQDKNWISILFCTNATVNHKFHSLVIGKSFNLRCFKNFNKSALPVIYRVNSKVWMRSDIFVEWLNHLDYYFCTLNRKILLIIDNASSYFNPKRFEKNDNNISNDEMSNEENNEQGSNKKKQKNKTQQKKNIPNLTNIELAYLPSNTTAHLQPMDAGIINSFKSKYKREFCKHLIQQFDSGIDYRK